MYRFTIVLIISLLSLCALVLLIFFSSIGFNPIQSEVSHQKLINTFVPQGWAFFTRSSREAQVLLYTVEGETLTPVRHKHSDISKAFGLSRKSTVIISEIGVIRSKIPDSLFVNSEWSYQTGRTGEFPRNSVPVENEVAKAVLCGEYVLVFQKAVPWAWSKSVEQVNMPAKVIRLDIICNE